MSERKELAEKLILVVSTERSIRDLVSTIIIQAFPDNGIVLCDSSAEAISHLKDASFDLMITDYKLDGGHNGYELINRVNNLKASKIIDQPGLKTLMMSSSTTTSNADGFIAKPFELEAFQNMVKFLLSPEES